MQSLQVRPAAASPQAALLKLGWEGRRAGLLFRVNPPQPCRRRSLTVNAGGKRCGIHHNLLAENVQGCTWQFGVWNSAYIVPQHNVRQTGRFLNHSVCSLLRGRVLENLWIWECLSFLRRPVFLLQFGVLVVHVTQESQQGNVSSLYSDLLSFIHFEFTRERGRWNRLDVIFIAIIQLSWNLATNCSGREKMELHRGRWRSGYWLDGMNDHIAGPTSGIFYF